MWAAKYCSILFSSTWNKLIIFCCVDKTRLEKEGQAGINGQTRCRLNDSIVGHYTITNADEYTVIYISKTMKQIRGALKSSNGS